LTLIGPSRPSFHQAHQGEVFDEYSIETPGGASRQLIYFCPWCGERLPPSKRDQWFDQLEAQGFDPLNDQVPEPYKTAAWRLEQ
jgi:hypothetical protein